MTVIPKIPAKLPGIAIVWAKEAQAIDIAEEEEAEVQEVEEEMDQDREIPHLAFGQKDQTLEDYDIGNVDMVLAGGLDEQQLIDSIVDPANGEHMTPRGLVTNSIHNLNLHKTR